MHAWGMIVVLNSERKLMIAVTCAMSALVIAMFLRDPEAARPWQPNIRSSERPRPPSSELTENRDGNGVDRSPTPIDDSSLPPTPSPGNVAFIRVVDAAGRPRSGVPVMWRDADPLVSSSRALTQVVLTDNDGLAGLPRPIGSAVAVPLVLLEEPLSAPIQLQSHETPLKTPPLGILDVQLVAEDDSPWQGSADVRVLVGNRDPILDSDVAAMGVREAAQGHARFAHVETDALFSIEASVVGGSVAPKLVLGPQHEGDLVVVKMVVDPRPAVTPDRVIAVAAAKGPSAPLAEAPAGLALVMPKVKVGGRSHALPKWPTHVEVLLSKKGERLPSGASRLDSRDIGGVAVAPGVYAVTARLWRAGAKGWRVTEILPPSAGWPTVKAIAGVISQPTLVLDATALSQAAKLLADAP